MAGVGIFGGTFDPVHFGHLRSAWDVMQALSLQEIQFIPSAQPVHRDVPAVTTEHRLAMLRLAIAEVPQWQVSDCELQRGGPSYTYDTLTEMRQRVGADQPLWLLVGSDAFEGFVTWHRWQEILTLANVAVMVRAGQLPVGCLQTERLLQSAAGADVQANAGQIQLVSVTALAISATEIRQSLGHGEVPHFLLPKIVLDYIDQHQLYRVS